MIETDYSRGWKQGYFDVSTGSDGQPPPIAPRRYWGPGFQTPDGQDRVQTWFDGYHDGTIAADADGRREFVPLGTSPELAIVESPLSMSPVTPAPKAAPAAVPPMPAVKSEARPEDEIREFYLPPVPKAEGLEAPDQEAAVNDPDSSDLDS